MQCLKPLLFIFLLTGTALGQDEDRAKRMKEAVNAQREAIAKSLKGKIVSGSPSDLTLHDKPIYKYHEVARGFHHATTWLWKTETGRPAFILNLSGQGGLFYEFMSMTNDRFDCNVSGVNWTPRAEGWVPKEIPGAKPPGKSPAIRLVQMRAMARKFTAFQMDHEKKNRERQLRMLPQPVYRFDKEDDAALDGAVFAFVRDGDLEIILTIAAAKTKDEPPQWVFDCDRVAIFAQSVKYDDKEVWSCNRTSFGSARDEYYVRVIQTPAPTLED